MLSLFWNGCSGSARFGALAVPGDEPAEPVPDGNFGRVAQEPRRLGDIGEGDRDVPGLRRKIFDPRLDGKLLAEDADQIGERGGVGAAEVEDLEAGGELEGGEQAV